MTGFTDRLDPELVAGYRARPVLDFKDLAGVRSLFHARPSASLSHPDVERADDVAVANDDEPVRVRVFRPRGEAGPLPCLYWIPGGGYVLTSPDLDDEWCERIALRHRCAVVAVEWRRAPEHPFPAAADDCYGGLAWLTRETDALGIDPARIMIGGMSSGGGSAAGLALLVRDRGELQIVHQLLVYPMLDDTSTTPSSHAVTDPRLWHREANVIAWRAYLGDTFGTDDVSPYAAPTRMADLSGLAPATMLTGELDLFADEDIDYAQRLMAAGVSVELHVYRGAPHGFPRMNPHAAVTRRFHADCDAAIERALTR